MFGKKKKIKEESFKQNVSITDSKVSGGREQKGQVLDTAGGEMPDPPKMPSKTKFHSDAGRK